MRHSLGLPWCCRIQNFLIIMSGQMLLVLELATGLKSQRHSALISSDSEMFHFWFSAVHYLKISKQASFSFEQRWKLKFIEERQNQSCTALKQPLISFEAALYSPDFFRFRLLANSRELNSDFQPKRQKQTTKLVVQCATGPNLQQKLFFWVLATAKVTELIWSKRLKYFSVQRDKFSGRFKDHSMRFNHTHKRLLRYHFLMFFFKHIDVKAVS